MKSQMVPLKHVVDPARPVMYGIVLPGPSQESGPMIIKGGDVKEGRLRQGLLCRTTAEIERKYVRSRVRTGDLVFAIRGGIGDIELVPAEIDGANLTQDVARVSPGRSVLSTWLYYALKSAEVQADVEARITGATIRGINIEELERVRVPVPDIERQRVVITYLDAQCARIDALVRSRRRMIQLLSELRASTVQQALRGHREASRQRSTIPWLADLPAAWDQAMLKLVAKLGSGHTPSRNHAEWWIPEECVIPWVTTGEVSQMRSDRLEYLETTRECISEIGMANSSAVVHPQGTVVLCRTAASAGYSAIIARDMAVSQDIAAWRCGPRLRPRFLLLCLRAMRADLLERLAMGSTHRTIYMPDIESIRVPLPPVEEQDRVVDEVWSAWHVIDRAVDQIEIQLERLSEHRQALITAAVTGEHDVSSAA